MIVNNLLSFARQVPSPNCSERADVSSLELLVLHNISLPPGLYGGGYIEDFFSNRLDISADPYFQEIAQLRVSAHLLIERDGSVIQFVPFDMKAWHAGKSSFRGRENCNEFSIGIELEGCDHEPFTEQQYARLVEVVRLLMEAYPHIAPDSIVGHSDIAPGRKTDPGPFFDWAFLRAACA